MALSGQLPLVSLPPQMQAELRMSGLAGHWGACNRCGLCQRRRHMIWGAGSLRAPIMIVNSTTSGYDNQNGTPLAGPGGELVAHILTRLGLNPARDCYVTNLVKCLCPKKSEEDGTLRRRLPTHDEVEVCKVAVEEQIKIIDPCLLILYGQQASRYLLGDPRPLAKFAGHWRTYGKRCVALSAYGPNGLMMGDDSVSKQATYFNLWLETAEKLNLLGRMWRPDAQLFQDGWAFNPPAPIGQLGVSAC